MKRNLITLALPLLLIALVGCAGRIATPEGWAGGVSDGETLYISTREGDFRALDIQTGELRRSLSLRVKERQASLFGARDADVPSSLYGTPVLRDDTLYFGIYHGVLYAVSTPGLDTKWKEPLGANIVSNPTLAGDVVLVGADNGKVYAFDQESDDQQRWEVLERWTYQTGNKVWSSPIGVDGVVYATSLDKNLYAISLEDGTKLWQFTSGGAIASTPAYDSGTVYFGSFDSVFYAVDAADGSLRWKFEDAGSWYWGSPLVHGDTVYAPSLDGNLYALDKRTGELRWTLETEGPIVGSPAVIFDMIAIGSDDGRLHIARISDGNPVDSCNMRTEIRSSLAVSDDIVFLSAKDKTIRALRVKTNGNPDEEWVHNPEEEEPVLRGRVEDC
ncbi:MAG: PQQ-binding-like beta-propeller repeat protein [Chloroflexota bacterium]|nr:PQQ-binding-like beta-propeller repeat protein [Chloroflexota bacterium]